MRLLRPSCLLFAFVLSTLAARAQGSLTSGGWGHGIIAPSGDIDVWTATATAGDRLYFKIAEAGDNTAFWPRIELIDPDGLSVVAGAGGITSTIERTAAKSGTYSLLVSDGSGASTPYTGSYRVHFLRLPGGFVVPEGDEGGALTNGSNHPGVIHVGDYDAWTVSAAVGDRLCFKLAEAGGDTAFVPRIELVDPDGAVVVAGAGSLVTTIERTAAKAGTYTLVVRDDSAGGFGPNSGDYLLHFLQVPGGFVVPAGDEGGALTNGANHPGVIHVGDYDAWTVEVAEGDRLLFKIAETAADTAFLPRLELIDPDGASVAATAGNVTTTLERTAAKSGPYTLVVRDGSAGDAGPNSGSYRLHFLRIPGGFVVSEGDEGGALANGAHQAGAIHVGDLDGWTIAATVGNPLRFVVAETGADSAFQPRILLYDPTGAFVTGVSGGITASLNATAARTGNYTLVLRDDSGGGTGPNAGAYTLYAANLGVNAYLTWLNTYFAAQLGYPASEPTHWGPAADPDGDGVNNLAEYYLGRNPTVRESTPVLTQTLTPDALVCEFRRKAGALAATGAVEWSADLAAWSTAGVTYDAPVPDGAFEIVRAYVPLTGGAKLFARLRVTATP